MKTSRFSRNRLHFGLPIAVFALFLAWWGCAWPVDENCERYLSCRASFDAAFDLAPADVSDYEAGGRCWETPQSVSRCRQYCLQGLAEMRMAAQEAGEELIACQ